MSNEVMVAQQPQQFGLAAYSASDKDAFEMVKVQATALMQTDLVPKHLKDNKSVASVIIAMEMAKRMNLSLLAVMQNVYVVYGTPSWKSSFVISLINNENKRNGIGSLEYKFIEDEKGEPIGCYAYAVKNDGTILRGVTVRIEMAKAEGWTSKAGSKWKTMPGQMLAYRAATFWSRIYRPEVLLGLQTADEVEDVEQPLEIQAIKQSENVADRVTEAIQQKRKKREVKPVENNTVDVAATVNASQSVVYNSQTIKDAINNATTLSELATVSDMIKVSGLSDAVKSGLLSLNEIKVSNLTSVETSSIPEAEESEGLIDVKNMSQQFQEYDKYFNEADTLEDKTEILNTAQQVLNEAEFKIFEVKNGL